jgi:hypothetical protein
MAEFVGFKYYITVAGVELSQYVTSLKITMSDELKEWVSSNPSGTSAQRHRLFGVEDLKIDVEYAEDLAAGKVYDTHRTNRRTAITIVTSVNGSTPAESNPQITATMLYTELPLGGAVNEVMKASYSYMLASGSIAVAVS